MSARKCPSQGAERLPSDSRVYWLDVARTVAILSITLNHAVNRTYSNYSDQMGEFLESSLVSSLLKTVTTVFSHLGVPLFLMISGALLLSKRMETGEDVRHFYRRNLLSLFITSEIWYFIMYWFLVLADPGQEALRHSTALHLIGGLVKTMLFGSGDLQQHVVYPDDPVPVYRYPAACPCFEESTSMDSASAGGCGVCNLPGA